MKFGSEEALRVREVKGGYVQGAVEHGPAEIRISSPADCIEWGLREGGAFSLVKVEFVVVENGRFERVAGEDELSFG